LPNEKSDTAALRADRTPSFELVGVTWDAGSADEDVEASIRHLTDEGWSDWVELPHGDDHGPDPGSAEAAGARAGTDPLLVPASTGVEVVVETESGDVPPGLRVDLVDPGDSPTDATAGTAQPASATALAAKPAIYTRAEWGADESIRGSTVEYAEVNAGFVHHTVNSNNYTAEQVPSLIRSIYAYHVVSRGWRDIGYNFLVDRFGRIWEGRFGGVDKPVVGAHTSGYNDDAFAMSTIGTFTTTQPGPEIVAAYQELFAWKLGVHRVDADSVVNLDGTSFPAISGHRDANATECPGDALYSALPEIRAGAAALQDASRVLAEPVRLAGANRYGTAAAVAAGVWPSASSVVVVDGRDKHRIDGLVAGPLTGVVRGPLVLSSGSVLPEETVVALDRRGSALRRAYVVGGQVAVPESVVSALAARGMEVVRLAGPNRYATAAAVAERIMAETRYARYWSVLASGAEENLVDALAASGPAASQKRAIVLTAPDELPEVSREVLEKLNPPNLLVVGGPSAVSMSVETEVASLADVVMRAGGADRYATAVEVVKAFSPYLPDRDKVVLVSGADPNLIDAISAGSLRLGTLLVTRASVPDATRDWLDVADGVRALTVVGGPASVGEQVVRSAMNVIEP
jgi:putative cell wall-binding protein